jgi:8-oxo-dGTP pyrophosphatase MutT (NUDIX family)
LYLELPNHIVRLKKALANQLPGENAHRLMLPVGRVLQPTVGSGSILQSSVLMLLFPENGNLNTCMIRRPTTMRNHGGQVAFPGGRFEPSDISLEQTALRESFEEIGTDRNKIELIGELTPLYVQVSNFTIHPFIGWCDTPPIFKTDNQEVEELYKIPIIKFIEHASPHLQNVDTIHGPMQVPGFYIDNLFIWGATAMIVSEFNEVYKSEFLKCPKSE